MASEVIYDLTVAFSLAAGSAAGLDLVGGEAPDALVLLAGVMAREKKDYFLGLGGTKVQ